MALTLERTYRFSASHLYRRPDWSEEENVRQFGRCANLPGHGHNYRLTLGVAGEPDPRTGFLVDLAELDRVVAEHILEVVDHRHLNEAIEEFGPGGAIPTSENLTLWVRRRLEAALPAGARLHSVRIAEDDDLAASWNAGPA